MDLFDRPPLDIWEASVETGSPVMLWWWYPDATVQKYEGTPGEFHPIVLPDPTEECRDARIGSEERCSEDLWVRRGSSEGKCDEEAHSLKRLVAASLGEETYKVAAAERSPGYQTVKNIAIDNLNLETMLGDWSKNGDVAREAVCGWIAENIDKVMDFVPRGHPRSLVVNDWYGSEAGLLYAAMAIGGISIASVILSSWIVYRYRSKRIIRNSQLDFLFLVLFGCLLVGVAGLVYSLEPGKGTCTAKQFLIMLGFTLMMVPLLVKIEAILWIQRAGKKMKRVDFGNKISRILGCILATIEYLLRSRKKSLLMDEESLDLRTTIALVQVCLEISADITHEGRDVARFGIEEISENSIPEGGIPISSQLLLGNPLAARFLVDFEVVAL